jgi:hypothetical protein
MQRKIGVVLVSVLGTGLIVAALWGWQRTDWIIEAWGPQRLEAGIWAVRCAALAALAAGEGLLIAGVVARSRRRSALTNALGLSALLVFVLCVASAVALGLAGR